MIKALLRFMLLLMLCSLLVFAPEILTRVSAPYALTPPERVLLRVALCTGSDTASQLHASINAYQKQHPHIHLRVTHASMDLFARASAPYADVVFYGEAPAQPLPAGFEPFSCDLGSDAPFCAIAAGSRQTQTAAEFAAYIYETFRPDDPASEI